MTIKLQAVATMAALAALLSPATGSHNMVPTTHHAVTRCHPTQHGACWFWTCCF